MNQAPPDDPPNYERLAMHNYSMFYHASTAKRAIEEDRTRFAAGIYPRPEQIFVAMKSAIEQAKKLQFVARHILKVLDIDRKGFPSHPEALYQTIGAYRNAFAHNPVLGRAIDHKRELLPPKHRLPKRENDPILLWSETAQITSSEMIDGVKLLDDSWQELAAFLQAQWTALAKAFVEARKQDKFIKDLGLKVFLPINCATAEASISGPPAASGTSIVARSDAH